MSTPGGLLANGGAKPPTPTRCSVVAMVTSTMGRPIASHTGIFSSIEARPGATREEELAELERTLRAAILSTLAEAAGPVMIASAQRADQYSALALAGVLDASAMRAVGAHLRGQLDAGSRHVVVDLSRARRVDERLTALLRRVEARMAAGGGVLELTGLTPRVLHDMDDDPLARVFALHRAAFEHAHPPELTWDALRCPDGLDEVAEPRTAARHRAIIDTGAGRIPRQERRRTRAPGAAPPAGHGG